MTPTTDPVVLADYTRSDFVEGVHVGHAVVVDPSGAIVRQWGDAQHVIFPRSCNKPAQAAAMVAAGLDVPGPLLALAVSSHSAEAMHLSGVHELLARARLEETALQTPADYPYDVLERDRWVIDRRPPSSIAMNCSGKHAAMLLTCAANGWSIDDYLDTDHPLQLRVRSELERLAGEQVSHVGVDGCGAPVLCLTLAGLARSLSGCVREHPGKPARRVVDAMRAFPEMVGGSRRHVTAFMRAVPSQVAKDGAEGLYVAALAGGTAAAITVEDGTDRARTVALAAILVGLGCDPSALVNQLTRPVFGGSAVVGRVQSPLA